MMRLRDFSCGLFFMLQVSGTIVMYIKGRKHKLQRSAFYFMFYLLLISVFEFYVFFIDNILGSQERPVTDMLQTTAVPLALFLLYRLTHPYNMRFVAAACNVAPYVLAISSYIVQPDRNVYEAILWVALAHSIFIILYGAYAVKRFNSIIIQSFSSDDRLSLRWMWYILTLFLALAATWFVATKTKSPLGAAAYNTICSSIFASLCYFIYRQEDMLEVLDASNKEKAKADVTDTPPLTLKAMDNAGPDYHFAQHLEKVFVEDEIFLNPTLNINDLAQALHTNRTYISNYLNQQLDTSFYEYVNGWRVDKAKQLLTNTELTLEEITMQSGFNSLSSFRRYFVSATGLTPSACRRRNK